MLQEVNEINEHLAVTEASYFLEYYRIAAQGECILINFVLEDEDFNDILVDIIDEACKMCPMIDRSRIYLSGHSHNGYFSVEFATRHPKLIAAVATYGNNAGLQPDGNISIPDEKVERMRQIDMPLVNTTGYVENNLFWPMNRDGNDYRPGQGKGPRPVTFEQRAETWQRRLRASNCPMKTYED